MISSGGSMKHEQQHSMGMSSMSMSSNALSRVAAPHIRHMEAAWHLSCHPKRDAAAMTGHAMPTHAMPCHATSLGAMAWCTHQTRVKLHSAQLPPARCRMYSWPHLLTSPGAPCSSSGGGSDTHGSMPLRTQQQGMSQVPQQQSMAHPSSSARSSSDNKSNGSRVVSWHNCTCTMQATNRQEDAWRMMHKSAPVACT